MVCTIIITYDCNTFVPKMFPVEMPSYPVDDNGAKLLIIPSGITEIVPTTGDKSLIYRIFFTLTGYFSTECMYYNILIRC